MPATNLFKTCNVSVIANQTDIASQTGKETLELQPIDFKALGGQFWSHTNHDLTVTGWLLESTAASQKPILHFLHGNGFCSATYWPLLSRLRQDFALCLTDLPGHGASPIPGTEAADFPTWRACAAVTLDAIQHQQTVAWGNRPVFALAHSMGGVITTLMASLQPQQFEQCLLLDPVWFPRSLLLMLTAFGCVGQSHRLGYVKAALRRRQQWQDRTAAVKALSGRGIYQGWEAGALENFVANNITVEGKLVTPPVLEAHYFATPYTAGLWQALHDLQTPTHAIYGDQTYPFVEKGLQRAVRKNAHMSTQKAIGGHCFMLQDSAAAAEMVRSYFVGCN